MKNKKGFVFVETIITIVFLAAALLILYSSYRNAITEEKEKIYYDDIGYLYRNYYLADFLINKSNVHSLKETGFKEKYIIEITEENVESLFTEEQIKANQAQELISIEERFNVSRMLIVSDEVIVKCMDPNKKECKDSYNGLSDGLEDYIKTMEIEEGEEDAEGNRLTNYYLVTEYREKSTEEGLKKCSNDEENCGTFYVSLKLDINRKIENAQLSIGKVCKGQNLSQCLKDNYSLENIEDEEGNKSGIFHHDGDGEDSGNGEKEAGDNSYRYGGDLVNNWVCFGSDLEPCPEENMYRIVGVFGNNLKIIKNQGENNSWHQVDVLNLKSYESKWQNMVVNKEWYTQGFNLDGDAQAIYNAEIRGTTTKSENGLMYVSDYMYGASPKYWNELRSNYGMSSSHNWLYSSKIEWLISPEVGSSNSYAVNTAGNVLVNGRGTSSLARGSIYLKETVILSRGEGTHENPFRLANIGAVVSNLTGKEDYYDIEVNIEATTDEGEIVKYYYSIDKGEGWSEWIESTNSSYTFDNLEPDTEYPIKVKVLNSRGNYSEEKDEKFITKYEAPTLEVLAHTSEGDVASDEWTNKDLTIEGKTSGGIGVGYDVYYCRTSGASCDPNTKANSMTDTNEGEENICYKTVGTGARKEASAVQCFKSKIDKQAPTCSLTATEAGVSIASKNDTGGSEIAKYGITKTTEAGYDNPTMELSAGTFYGHILDNAGNHGSCNRDIVETDKTFDKTTRTCKSYEDSYTCRKKASSSTYCDCVCQDDYDYPVKNSFYASSCSSGCIYLKYHSGYGSCSTSYSCSSGTKSGSYCYKYNQSSCGSWSKYSTNYGYEFKNSTAKTTSCTVQDSISCNSSHNGSSYVSKCVLESAVCSAGTQLTDYYCLI